MKKYEYPQTFHVWLANLPSSWVSDLCNWELNTSGTLFNGFFASRCMAHIGLGNMIADAWHPMWTRAGYDKEKIRLRVEALYVMFKAAYVDGESGKAQRLLNEVMTPSL